MYVCMYTMVNMTSDWSVSAEAVSKSLSQWGGGTPIEK